jgi:hypothetical protein
MLVGSVIIFVRRLSVSPHTYSVTGLGLTSVVYYLTFIVKLYLSLRSSCVSGKLRATRKRLNVSCIYLVLKCCSELDRPNSSVVSLVIISSWLFKSDDNRFITRERHLQIRIMALH